MKSFIVLLAFMAIAAASFTPDKTTCNGEGWRKHRCKYKLLVGRK